MAALVTLDNRRIALPRSAAVKVLSIRAGDTVADPGVLPPDDDVAKFGICLLQIAGSKHNDMQDAGSTALKGKITHAIKMFVAPSAHPKYSCDSDSRSD